jgi:2-amino-4-hydroxy-6-hydroxymethyldihydropteridine diphosphokinase
VPHPLISERRFVVAPLSELAPDVLLPGDGRTIGAIAEDMDFAGIEHVAAPHEWWG